MDTSILFVYGKGKMIRPGIFGNSFYSSCCRKNSSGRMTISYLCAKAIEYLARTEAIPGEEGVLLKGSCDESEPAIYAKLIGTAGGWRQIHTLEEWPDATALAALLYANGALEDEDIKVFLADLKTTPKFCKAADAAYYILKDVLPAIDESMFLQVKEILAPGESMAAGKTSRRRSAGVPADGGPESEPVDARKSLRERGIRETGLIRQIAGWLDPENTAVRNIFLFGPQGVGKSLAGIIGAEIAGYAKDEIFVDKFYEGIQADHLVGGYVPLESGGFRWQESKFIAAVKKALATGKALWICEEINFVKAGISGVLHDLLEPVGGCIELENGEKIAVPKTLKVIATCNPAFAGTKEMNPALLDRFQILQPVKELPRDVLTELVKDKFAALGGKPSDTAESARQCLAVYDVFRKKAQDDGRGIIIGPRMLLNWAGEIVRCRNVMDAAERTILPMAAALPSRPDEDFAKELRDHVLKAKLAIL